MNPEPTDKIEEAIKSLEQFLRNSPEYYHEEGDLIVLLVEELRRLFEPLKGGIGLVHVEMGLIKGGKRHDIVIIDNESLRQVSQDSAWLRWIVSREREKMPTGIMISGIIEVKQGYSIKEFTNDEKDKIKKGLEELLCEINNIRHRLVPKATLHLVYVHRTCLRKPIEELRREAEVLFNETVDEELEKYALRGWRDRIKFHPIFLHKQEWR